MTLPGLRLRGVGGPWRFEWLFCWLVVAALAVADEEYDVILPSVGVSVAVTVPAARCGVAVASGRVMDATVIAHHRSQ